MQLFLKILTQFALISGFIAGITPEPRLTVSEWSDKYRYLDRKAAAETGLYRTIRTPYLKEPMDKLSVMDPVKKIIVMKGVQLGATEMGMNWIGYIIDNAPGPILAVQPTDEMVKRNSKMRIAPMIDASPTLRNKVKPSRSKDSGNTINQKEFPGGVLIMTGANSAVGLRSMPARFIMLDEVDAYPMDVNGEGSPISLAEKRASTFSNKKILEISTPTIDGQSVIAADFLQTDQKYYHVPCPHCGAEQILEFKFLKWEKGKYDDVHYQCAHCSELIEERFKTTMLENGRWIATVPENSSVNVSGYHVSTLYSPFGWKSWAEIAEEWDKAQGDDNKIKTFVNTILGETYKVKSDAPEWEKLYERAEDYSYNKAFKDVVVITAGADVQGDRIEVEIVGWMPGMKSQQLDFRVLLGDTAKDEVWEELSSIVNEVWERADGQYLPLRLMAVDSGYNSPRVYQFTKKHGFSRTIPIKGQEALEALFSPPRAIDIQKHGKKIGKQKVWHVGVNYIKSELYGFLRQNKDLETGSVPNGYCYFPKRDTHYFRGLTAEVQQLTRNKRGYLKYIWIKKYERNEPLDCFDVNTEILTKDGWKYFKDINKSNELATVNLLTDEIEYQQPLMIIDRFHKGQMLSVNSFRLDFMVTPNHRMVTYKKKKIGNKWNFNQPAEITLAKDLTLHHQIKTSAKWNGESFKKVTIAASYSLQGRLISKEKKVNAKNMAAFLGWYVSEGGVFTGRSKTQNNMRYRVEITQSKKQSISNIENLLKKLPFKYHTTKTHKTGTCIKFIFTSKQLAEYVSECGIGTYNKKVPQWIKDASPEIITEFLSTAIEGDGWIQKKEKHHRKFRTYATTSKVLADDIQELFLKTGKASNIKIKPAQPYTIRERSGNNTVTQYHVSELNKVKASLDGNTLGNRKFIGQMVDYEGKVYCATVPNGTLIVRRNGRAFIAGNCRVYARAASAILGIDRWKEQRWKQEALFTVEKPVKEAPPVPVQKVNKVEKPKSSFWNRS